MAFTISDDIPPLVYGVGQSFVFQPAMAAGSTPAPSGWSATGLPAGVSINATSGKISGAATEVGVFSVVLTATGSGPVSDTQSLLIGITDRVGMTATLGGAIELDIDVRTGYVSVPNVIPGVAENGERGAIIYANKDDVLQFAGGFLKDGELQDILIADLKLALKNEDTDETPVVTGSGVFWKSGEYDQARYVFESDLAEDDLGDLLDEEADEEETFVDLIAKIQWVQQWYPPGTDPEDDPAPTPRELVRTSQGFKIRVASDFIASEAT